MMKFYQDKKSVEFKVGLFTLIAIIILVLGYFWFMEVMENRKYTEIKVKFGNAGNIESGSAVSILGVKKGRVKDISMASDGVTLNLQAELDFSLKKDTEFYIIETDIMGDVQVEIIPGQDNEMLDLSLVHHGFRNQGISGFVSQLGVLVRDVQELLNSISEDKEFIKGLFSFADSSQSFINKLNKSYDKNSENIENLITNASSISNKLETIISQNEESINSSLNLTNEVLNDFNSTLSEMDIIVKNFRDLSTKMVEEDSSFNKIITEKELYEKLLKSAVSLDSLLIDIKKNPGKYFKVKVF